MTAATPVHQLEPGSAEWHDARRRGIGGSDWIDVLSLEPYGCARRLWYAKRDQPPDFPQPEEPAGYLVRGQRMEGLIADEAAELYRRTVRRPGLLRNIAGRPDWWIGNPDRMIAAADERGSGVLEIKTMNPFLFTRLKREGARLYHLAQVHHYIGLTGWRWGVLWVKEPVSWEDYVVPVERDEELLSRMLHAGNVFWDRVIEPAHAGPDRLPAKDRRCADCQYRWTCQGEALTAAYRDKTPIGDIEEVDDPELLEAVQEYLELGAIAKEAKTEQEGRRDRIKELLGGERKVSVAGRRVYYTRHITNRLDTRALRDAHPALAEEFTRPSETETVRIY